MGTSDAEGCLHLTVEVVEEIHAKTIARFGGSDGLRDRGLLESAVLTPQATFGGQSPYADAVEVAGAYLYYLCNNHPFIDGNKRVALGACLLFLRLNGLSPAPDSDRWEAFAMDVAAWRLSRAEATERLRELVGGCPTS